MQPHMDQFKPAGVIGLIAGRNSKVRYKNLLGYADVEAKTRTTKVNYSLGYHLCNGMFGHDGA